MELNNQHSSPERSNQSRFTQDSLYNTGKSLPEASWAGSKVEKWLKDNPGLADLRAYFRSVDQNYKKFTFSSYSAILAEKIKAQSRSQNSGGAEMFCAIYQKAVYESLNTLASENRVLHLQVAERIIHACAWMQISHPLLKPALEKFYDNRRKIKNQKCQSDIALLQRLSKESNLAAVGAQNEFIDTLKLFGPEVPGIIPNVSMELRRLLACALAASESDFRGFIAKDFSAIGAVNSNDIFTSMQYAMLWCYCNPGRSLPRHIEYALRAKRSQREIITGKSEIQYGSALKQGMFRGLSELKARNISPISSSKFLPFECGPYSSDFYQEARLSGQIVRVALELDGQQHYCLTDNGRVLAGKDQLRIAILADHQTKVIHLSNEEVRSLGNGQLVAYVALKVKKCLSNQNR